MSVTKGCAAYDEANAIFMRSAFHLQGRLAPTHRIEFERLMKDCKRISNGKAVFSISTYEFDEFGSKEEQCMRSLTAAAGIVTVAFGATADAVVSAAIGIGMLGYSIFKAFGKRRKAKETSNSQTVWGRFSFA